KKDGVATITINRQDALNALNTEAIAGISRYLKKAGEDTDVKVIVITGAGEKAFCAGLDLKTVQDISVVKAVETSRLGQKLTLEVEELGKPVIAAINGYALGGGLELAMACDIRIASDNARLGQTELNVGLIPGWGGTQRLPRLVGKGIAKELIFTGKMIDAQTAERIGLINIVVPKESLGTTVQELTVKIMSKPPIALRLVKELVDSSVETDIVKGLKHEAETFGILSSTDDYREGVLAFIGKRKPEYKGK
ncbi:MAG: enoyl-CoA hydratase/isomerase family protein, partial [Candidatus Hodarchaeota archaeon]